MRTMKDIQLEWLREEFNSRYEECERAWFHWMFTGGPLRGDLTVCLFPEIKDAKKVTFQAKNYHVPVDER